MRYVIHLKSKKVTFKLKNSKIISFWLLVNALQFLECSVTESDRAKIKLPFANRSEVGTLKKIILRKNQFDLLSKSERIKMKTSKDFEIHFFYNYTQFTHSRSTDCLSAASDISTSPENSEDGIDEENLDK